MTISQPITQPIKQPITRRTTLSSPRDDTRSTTLPAPPGRWERALLAAASSLATVAFAFGAPLHPRAFSRHVQTRQES
ncbi:hypothetical protein ACVBEQ_09655 [Nakamurella sp. GG22]